MSGEWILILFLYAGALADGDSVTVTSIPGFYSEMACAVAGQRGKELVRGTMKESRFICVESGYTMPE